MLLATKLSTVLGLIGSLMLSGGGTAQTATALVSAQNDFKTSVPSAVAHAGFADRLSVWGVKDGVIQIGLTKIHGDELSVLKKQLGPNVKVFQQDRFESAVKKTPLKTKVPIHLVKPHGKKSSLSKIISPTAMTPSNVPPFIDSRPYYGGDRIVRTEVRNGATYVVQCTVSAPYVKGSTTYMMTAGHCGPTGTTWNQGYFDGSAIYVSGPMGKATSVQWGNNRTDGALLSGASYAPYIWTNGASYSSAHVTGAANVVPGSNHSGTAVCTDGSFTRYKCGGTVSFINACANISEDNVVYNVCGLDVADSSTPIVQSGDSGGPVVVPVPGGVQMAGTISAQANTGTRVLFSDVKYLQQIFAVTVAS